MNGDKDWAKYVPCRNVSIHGFCKFEGKGCSFKHEGPEEASKSAGEDDPARPALSSGSSSGTSSTTMGTSYATGGTTGTSTDGLKKKFNPAAASVFTPTELTPKQNKFTAMLSPSSKSIPTFIPGADQDHKHFNPETPAFQPANLSPGLANLKLATPQQDPHDQDPYPGANDYDYYQSAAQQQLPPQHIQQTPQPQPQPQQPLYPLNYHLYAPATRQHLLRDLNGNEQNIDSLAMSNKIREDLTKKNEAILKTLPGSNLPDHIGPYYDLVPLDNVLEKTTITYGYLNSAYKVFSNENGCPYTLRRIENVNITKEKSISLIQRWKKVKNSNIVGLNEAFTSRGFGDNSLIVIYDYYPNAKTLLEAHFHSSLNKTEPITFDLLWSYMIQITNALVAIHDRKLVARSISLNKIIITNSSLNKIRLSDIGVFDILEFDETKFNNQDETILKEQQQDLVKFGKVLLILSIAKLPIEKRSLPQDELIDSLEVEDDFKTALKYLLDETIQDKSIKNFQNLISHKLFKYLDLVQTTTDYYEQQLTKELENARVFRLLSKLNFLIDRPENINDKDWLETGYKYPIKLFKEYCFNQMDERGRPVIDLAWVLKTLNKLDAGIEENILLVSHDEQTCLILSYKQLKLLIDKAFRDLIN